MRVCMCVSVATIPFFIRQRKLTVGGEWQAGKEGGRQAGRPAGRKEGRGTKWDGQLNLPSFPLSFLLAILPLPSFPRPSAAQPEPTTGSNNVNTINHPYAGVLVGHYRTLNETTCAKPVVVNERFGSPSSHFIIMCASITTFRGGLPCPRNRPASPLVQGGRDKQALRGF